MGAFFKTNTTRPSSPLPGGRERQMVLTPWLDNLVYGLIVAMRHGGELGHRFGDAGKRVVGNRGEMHRQRTHASP